MYILNHIFLVVFFSVAISKLTRCRNYLLDFVVDLDAKSAFFFTMASMTASDVLRKTVFMGPTK